MYKKILSIIILFVIIFSLSGCNEKELQIIGPNQVEVGSAISLTHNFDVNETSQWISGDEDVAIVKNGMVIGISEGTVIVSLIINEKICTKEILVISSSITIVIEGPNKMSIGEIIQLTAKTSKEINDDILWESSNQNIASVDETGKVKAKKQGNVIISATVYGVKSDFVINIYSEKTGLIIDGPSYISYGSEYQYKSFNFNNEKVEVIWDVDDNTIANINNDGVLTPLKPGKINIIATLNGLTNVSTEFQVVIVKPAPSQIIASCDNYIEVGKVNASLSIKFNNNECDTNVKFEVSDPTVAVVYNNMILGVKEGFVEIKIYSVVNPEIFDIIEIQVNKYQTDDPSIDEFSKAEQLLNKMSLSQKIGQMFVIGFSGTTMPNSLKNDIKEYNFGNIIYMGYNVTSPSTLATMTINIQEEMLKNNTVPGFITIDQEGGRVARLTNGGTHFISNMAIGATGKPNNAYLEGLAIGQELMHYGINVDFAPVLDVNNNPDNPIIGIRSYGDNPVLVSTFGNQMIKGLKESYVMGCSKHFPGHGNTSVDSHYGLPTITSSYDELYQTELAPFISSISNGIDAIMTTHIIFSAIDSNFPATLSEKVLTDLLRKELNYKGLIFTDGMEMGAITQNFGGHDKTSILAIKAGVDILTYTSSNNPKTAHKALIKAVNEGDISIDRINESVRRILLKKIKYGLLEEYIKPINNFDQILKQNQELNNKFAEESITLVKGDFQKLTKEESILIISPSTSYNLGEGLESNSFSNYACNYLKSKGYTKVDYKTVSNDINASEKQVILNVINNYDKVIIAMSNVKTNNYANTINFIKEVSHKTNLILIALDTPYDYLGYINNKLKNSNYSYICCYGYQKASVIALSKYLIGEFKAQGILPINKQLFE